MASLPPVSDLKVESHLLPDGGWCPNNPRCPLLIYRGVLDGPPNAVAEKFEALFAENGWPPAWRYTIYDFPHYHSTSHEVIGIFRGRATVRFGDAAGLTADLQAGDVVLIPAGVSHQRLSSSEGFEGVGAYPQGCEVDQFRKEDGTNEAAKARAARLPHPRRDPVAGRDGPLHQHWR